MPRRKVIVSLSPSTVHAPLASVGSASSLDLSFATRSSPFAVKRIAMLPSGGRRSKSPTISVVFGFFGGTASCPDEHPTTSRHGIQRIMVAMLLHDLHVRESRRHRPVQLHRGGIG